MSNRPTLEDLDADPDGTPWCCTGNAEDCRFCTDPNPNYPWICPGHPDTPDNHARVKAAGATATDQAEEYKEAVRSALYDASVDGALIFLDEAQEALRGVRDREMERMKVLVAASESPAHAVRLAAQYADRAIENGERADAAVRQVKQARALEAKWLRIAAEKDGATVRLDVAAGILKATLDGFNDLLTEADG
jgi:hypothetical protein